MESEKAVNASAADANAEKIKRLTAVCLEVIRVMSEGKVTVGEWEYVKQTLDRKLAGYLSNLEFGGMKVQ